jgi:hypothetical protein
MNGFPAILPTVLPWPPPARQSPWLGVEHDDPADDDGGKDGGQPDNTHGESRATADHPACLVAERAEKHAEAADDREHDRQEQRAGDPHDE